MSKLKTVFILLLLLSTVVLLLLGANGGDTDDNVSEEPAPTRQPTTAEPTYAPVATPTPRPAPSPAQEPPPTQAEPSEPAEPPYSDDEIEMLAKTVYGEAGICSTDEQRLVIWTILQRVDGEDWDNTIGDVITAKSQFVGYRPDNPIDPDIFALCKDELESWWSGAEPPTLEPYAPTAPYYYFDGDGRHNWYREEWR